MKFYRTGSAEWSGGICYFKDSTSTESGALNHYPYGFNSRFEDKPGSNPEELLGAAHAACFTMALSLVLERLMIEPKRTSRKANASPVSPMRMRCALLPAW